MKLFVSSFVAVLVLLGCTPEPPTANTNDMAQTPTAPVVVIPADTNIDIGDVEAVVSIALTVSTESRGPRVSVEDIVTPNLFKTLGMCNVTMTAPYPQTLVASITIMCEDKIAKKFADQPVALRGKVLREGVQVGSFSTVLGKYARETTTNRLPPEAVDVPQLSFTADIFQGLSTMPKTMLVYAEAEILLLDYGTDEKTVDPLTVTASPENKANIQSNPFRVDFVAVDSVQ